MLVATSLVRGRRWHAAAPVSDHLSLIGLTYYVAARYTPPLRSARAFWALTCAPCCFSLSWMSATDAVQLLSPGYACSLDGVFTSVTADLFCRPTAVVGLAFFVVGTVHQAKCHRILADLKKSRLAKRGGRRAGYGVPCGDWFDFSSCAHYLVRPTPALLARCIAAN